MDTKNELMIPSEYTESQHDLETFKEIAKAGDWLPRLQLFGANSDAVKRSLIPMAHWGLAGRKDDVQDLGSEVSVIPINWRPLALDMSDDQVISVYDRTDPLFAEIQAKSEEQNSGCAYGPQFLLWLPTERQFAEYHMSSKTSRNEAPKMLKLIGQHAILKSKLIETAKFSWHGPVVLPNPIAAVSVPDANKLKHEVTKFRNPPKKQVEKAEQAPESESRAR